MSILTPFQIQEGQNAKSLMNRLHDYVMLGHYYYQPTSGQIQKKYNQIIAKIESKGIPEMFVKLLTLTSWNYEYENEIYNKFTPNMSAVIVTQLKLIYNQKEVLETLKSSMQKHFKFDYSYSKFQVNNLNDLLLKITSKVKLYQAGLRLCAEYPLVGNIDKLQIFINENSQCLGYNQKQNFKNISHLRNAIVRIDKKLEKYIKNNYSGGFFKSQIEDRLIAPCQEIVQCNDQIYQFLTSICKNRPLRSTEINKDFRIQVANIVSYIMAQEEANKKQIEKINKKISKILLSVQFPFEQSQFRVANSQNLQIISKRLESIQQLIFYYDKFFNPIKAIRSLSSEGFENNLCGNYFTNYLRGKKQKWKRKLQICLEYIAKLSNIQIQTSIPEYNGMTQYQINWKIETVQAKQSNDDIIKINKQIQLYKRRWSQIQKYIHQQDQNIEIFSKQQSTAVIYDEQLQHACNEIVSLKKVRNMLQNIMEKNKVKQHQETKNAASITENKANLLEEINHYKKEIQYLQTSIDKLQSVQNNLLSELKKAAQFFHLPQVNYQTTERTILKFLENIVNQSFSQIQNIAKQRNNLKEEQQTLKFQLITAQEEHKQCLRRATGAEEQMRILKEKIIQRQQQLNQTINSLLSKDHQMRMKIQNLNAQKNFAIREKQSQSYTRVQLQKNLQNLKNDCNYYNESLNKLHTKLEEKDKNEQLLYRQLKLFHEKQSQQIQFLKQKEDQIQRLFQRQQQLLNITRKNENQRQMMKISLLFIRKSIIYERQLISVNIIQQIQRLSSHQIKNANCLLLFDKKLSKPINDIKSYANRSNNLLVIKTNNRLIVSFIMSPLLSTSDKIIEKIHQKAFILVSNGATNDIYKLKQEKVTYEYNNLQMIVVGASDLRIDLSSATLTSNMGVSNSQFETYGRKGKDIIGQTGLENVYIESMELYEIEFGQLETKIPNHINQMKIQRSVELIPNSYIFQETIVQTKENDMISKVSVAIEQNSTIYQKIKASLDKFKMSKQNQIKWVSQINQKIAKMNNKSQKINTNTRIIKGFISSIRIKMKVIEQERAQALRQLSQLKKVKEDLEAKLTMRETSKQNHTEQLNVKIEQLTNQNTKLKADVDLLSNNIKLQTKQIKYLESELENTKEQIKSQYVEIQNSKLTIEMMKENMIQQSMVTQHNNQIQALNYEIKSKEYQINLLKKQIKKTSEVEDLIKNLQQENKSVKQELEKQKNMIQEHKMAVYNNTKNMKVAGKGVNEAELRETILKQVISKNQFEFQAYKHKLKKLFIQKYSHLLQKINEKDLDEFSLSYMDKLFQGQLLQQQIGLKYRLANILQKFTNCMIVKTRLVYKLDLKNKTNFHTYIDGIQNLLCIIKTVSNIYLAGFYTGVYHDKPMTDPGLLISLTNNDSYRLHVPDHTSRTNYRAMVYDPYFIIFGNAQLRIKTGESTMFSNFGINNSYYNVNNKKLQDFVGPENKRESEIISYEIYEVLFSNSSYYE